MVSKFDWNVVEREAFAIKFNVWVSLVAFFTFISATFVLILIAEFFSHKRKKQKNNKKNLRKNSSVYKFNLE